VAIILKKMMKNRMNKNKTRQIDRFYFFYLEPLMIISPEY